MSESNSPIPDWKGLLKTIIIGGLGGGIAAIVATLADPSKYVFPRDLGSGKMWPFFFSGAAVAIGALFLKSPFGSKIMGQLKENQQTIADTKAGLRKEIQK